MTIHFAPAKGSGSGRGRIQSSAPVVRALARIALSKVANDNDGGTAPLSSGAQIGNSNDILNAALRHFGQHGLGAARAARIRAKQAFFEGDHEGYRWWLAITRVLDRRLAADPLHFRGRPAAAANNESALGSQPPKVTG